MLRQIHRDLAVETRRLFIPGYARKAEPTLPRQSSQVRAVDKDWVHLEDAVRVAAEIVAHYLAHPLPGHPLLNVNIPNLPYEQLRNWRVTRLGKRHPSQPVIRQTNPRGEPIYWIGPSGSARDASEGTDFHAVANGHVSITPLQLDLTHTQMLPAAHDWARAGSGAS